MIVKDKQLTIQRAHEISNELLDIIKFQAKQFDSDGDPAEQIYLLSHTIAALSSKICIILDGYGKIYGIPNMNCNNIAQWIGKITTELNEINTNRIGKQNEFQ